MSIKVSGRNRFDRTHIINLAESISWYILSRIRVMNEMIDGCPGH